MLVNRRTTIFGAAAFAAVTGSPIGAAGTHKGFGFVFKIGGQRFGGVLTAHSAKANLLTLRALDGNLRVSVRIPKRGSQVTEVAISSAGRKAVVALDGDTLVLRGKGLRLLGYTPHPSQRGGAPQTQGFFSNVIGWIGTGLGPIGDMLEGIAVGIAAALAWLVGAEFDVRFWGGRGRIWISEGSAHIGYDPGQGYMPPPEGTEEDPGVWY